MTKDNVAFLLAGLAFGALLGAGAINAFLSEPELAAMPASAAAPPAGPQGPAPANPTGGAAAGSGAAPMMEEIRALRERLEADPQNFEALVRMANIYHDVSMFEEAIGFYGRALEIEPDNPNLLTDLGICYRGQGEFERALELFAEAHAKDPQHWQSLFNTVIVAGFDLRRFDVAESALDKMEPLAPEDRTRSLRDAMERFRREGGERPS